jgi:hypothetical protein
VNSVQLQLWRLVNGAFKGGIYTKHEFCVAREKILSYDTNRKASTSLILSYDKKIVFCVNRPQRGIYTELLIDVGQSRVTEFGLILILLYRQHHLTLHNYLEYHTYFV